MREGLKREDAKYVVATKTGQTSTFWTNNKKVAETDCKERNEKAERLGVSERYEVIDQG